MITAVADASQVAEARRLVGDLARASGCRRRASTRWRSSSPNWRPTCSSTAAAGTSTPCSCDDAEGTGLELLALDRGSGMADPGRCMEDGYSTAGSPGNGPRRDRAPGRRRADLFAPGTGQRDHGALRRAPRRAGAPDAAGRRAGALSGRDRCAATTGRGATPLSGRTIMLVDGSGHGVEAARAAETAVRTFAENADAACEVIVERMHRALAPTRGAAVAVARIDAAARVVRFVGVGNIGAHAGQTRASRATWSRTTARPGMSRRASASSPTTSPAIRWSSCTPTG